jgi:DNA-directed RNA polymerase subunit beta
MFTLNKKIYKYLLPNLLETQRISFCWFLEFGFLEELEKLSAIRDYLDVLELNLSAKHYKIRQLKYTLAEAKRRDINYSVKIYTLAQLSYLTNAKDTSENEVLLCDVPLMTNEGTFLVNGIERIIINQVVRSPGIYYKTATDKQNFRFFTASLISNRGTWVKFEIDKDDLIYVKVDKAKKISAYIFLRAIGLTDTEIFNQLEHPEYFVKTFKEYEKISLEDTFLEIYSKLRPGEPATVKGGQQILYSRFFDPKRYDLGHVGRYKINKRLGLDIEKNIHILTSKDVLAIVNELINFRITPATEDDIDHLGNRRVRSVGELLQNQIRIGINRLERIAQERMSICEQKYLRVNVLVNPKPLVSSIREFFGSNPLSQFMDQTNPLAELTHKRRLSVLGPGGITRDRAGFAVRDIHPSQYGRICPIETPEGPNAGLIGSLSTYGRVNSYGFIETPFYKVLDGKVLNENFPVYLDATTEDNYNLAAGDLEIDQEGFIKNNTVPVRSRQNLINLSSTEVDYIAISPIQVVSLAAALIPFLEHDDANRALMGSNMQRQSVPLLYPEAPLVGTGLEGQTARDSGMVLLSANSGKISRITDGHIVVTDKNHTIFTYNLIKYQRSNQDTCINQKPIVSIKEKVVIGQILADGASTENGELSVGQNILIAYMPWEGYNYEDAFVISERLVYEDLYTSLHIEKFEIDIRQTKLGMEEVTRDLPNASEHSLRNLDQNGIVKIGTWVESGDTLVGKLTPKGESDYPPEGKLLRAIFGEKSRDVRNTSLKVPHGTSGRVLDVKIFSRSKRDDLPPGTDEILKVYIAQTRRIQIGDKMAGRHGNKGIISKILPRQDMPFMPDGVPVDMMLNPLGVPSRMNVGQLFECLLGLAADDLDVRFKIVPFDEMYGAEASRALVNTKLKDAAIKKDWLFFKEASWKNNSKGWKNR